MENRHYYYIDKLRVLLTCLVIFHHSMISFGAPGGWYYKSIYPWSPEIQGAMGIIVAINQAFFMSLFFFISAWLMPASFERKGLIAFTKDRFFRLGLPLFVFIFVLNPLLVGIIQIYINNTVDWNELYIKSLSPGPMWFVLTLLFFEFIYICIQFIHKNVQDTPLKQKLPTFFSIILFIILMKDLAFFIRLYFPTGTSFFDLQFGFFPLYLGMFYCGIIAYHKHWLENMKLKNSIIWLLFASIAILVYIKLVYNENFSVWHMSGGWYKEALFYASWEPIICIGISYFLLAAFKHWGNRENHLFRILAKDSYLTYIIHPFFVVGVTMLSQSLKMMSWNGFVFVCAVSTIFSFLVSHLIRKIHLIKRLGW